jgi:hypothetical protein
LVKLITDNLSTLRIHKLTQEQYDRELESGNIDENALYLTPDEFDITLTQSGKAADAKAVGDALAEKQPKGNYLTDYTETDPTVPAWAKAENKPVYTAGEVGADASGTANSLVSAHNTTSDSHNDIRVLIAELTNKLNTLADSDDTTLDQLSEIVSYIKANKSLIEGVTNKKVSIVDIINNLTTNVANKPLSAAQGVALKSLIDNINIPTTLKNPYTLTINGATYDGSKDVNMTEQINILIESKLGEIRNVEEVAF